MHAAVVAQRAGIDAHLVQVQAAQAAGRRGRAIKIKQAVGRMDADDDIRLEALHLAVQKARLGLAQGTLARPASRVFAGDFFPIHLGIGVPMGGGEIAVQVNPVGIDAGGRLGQQAVRVQGRHKAPARVAGRGLRQANPVQGQRHGRQLIAVDAAHHQHAQRCRLRPDIAHVDGQPVHAFGAAGAQLRGLAHAPLDVGEPLGKVITHPGRRSGVSYKQNSNQEDAKAGRQHACILWAGCGEGLKLSHASSGKNHINPANGSG